MCIRKSTVHTEKSRNKRQLAFTNSDATKLQAELVHAFKNNFMATRTQTVMIALRYIMIKGHNPGASCLNAALILTTVAFRLW
jgi:hypothetical protein